MQKRSGSRVIIFTEHNGFERVLPAATSEELSASCLLVLRERYSNPVWGYKPATVVLSDEEKDFVAFWEVDRLGLPDLLFRHGERLYGRLKDRLIVEEEDVNNPDWVWYKNVGKLLALKCDKAILYKIPAGGTYVPTSYYLLGKRKHLPNEGFVIAELNDNENSK